MTRDSVPDMVKGTRVTVDVTMEQEDAGLDGAAAEDAAGEPEADEGAAITSGLEALQSDTGSEMFLESLCSGDEVK